MFYIEVKIRPEALHFSPHGRDAPITSAARGQKHHIHVVISVEQSRICTEFLTQQILLNVKTKMAIVKVCLGSDCLLLMHLFVHKSVVAAWIMNAFWYHTARALQQIVHRSKADSMPLI